MKRLGAMLKEGFYQYKSSEKMVTSTSNSLDRPVGAVFTPKDVASFIISRFRIFQRWIDGASICDPTAGHGVFICALVEQAIRGGINLSQDLIKRLFYIEKSKSFSKTFLKKFYSRYKKNFPISNIYVCDVVTNTPNFKVDFLIGNPPWINFTDLDQEYKEQIKPFFLSSFLVRESKMLLLGSSRIDMTALVIATAVDKLLYENGEAVFLVPLSLFLNDGAHDGFRRYRLSNGNSYAVREIFDFAEEKVFERSNTRFGIASFQKGTEPSYPIPYHIFDGHEWVEKLAVPYPDTFSALTIQDNLDCVSKLKDWKRIVLRPEQKPRQGINTCGANGTFLFDEKPEFLPVDLVYPLLSKESFRETNSILKPSRYIFVPHDHSTGKPLDQTTLENKYPVAWDYLLRHKERLCSRRGSLISSWIKRGFWWACLGVGPYNFTEHKVVWEAFGKSRFKPIVVSSLQGKEWQANQALHAYIPCRSKEDAEVVAREIRQPFVEEYLLSCRMAGTRNWAQPGRIKNLIDFNNRQNSEFLPLFSQYERIEEKI